MLSEVLRQLSQVLRVAWYRFRVTFHHRWGGYLSVAVLIGLVGGLAMASVAGARRTQSSFPTFLASTNSSAMTVFTGPLPVPLIARLPGVKRVESLTVLNAAELGSNGAPIAPSGFGSSIAPIGSVNGLLFNQDRVTVVDGRMADPSLADQIVVTEAAARPLGLHVGQRISVGFYTNAQTGRPGFGTAAVQPHVRIDVTVVGIVVLNSAVVQDDASRSISALVVFTPALTSRLAGCCGDGLTQFGIQIQPNHGNVTTVESEIEHLLPAGSGFYVTDTADLESEAQQAIQPEAFALGVFGGIATLAALVIASQVIGRQLRRDDDDLATLRALGADPAMTISDGLVGILGAIVVGAVLAAALAVSLSPLSPIGPVRAVYPSPGVFLDWTVLGFGVLALVVVLASVACLLAYRQTPNRLSSSHGGTERNARVHRVGAALGLSTPALIGVKFALSSVRARNAAPVRSAIVGAAMALIVVIATVTFGASLNNLISHPALYGWNWNYELNTPEGGGYISEHQAAQLLDHTPDVAAWTGVYFDSLRVDGLTIPIIGENPDASVGPPLLSGHALEAPNQIVLGTTTLAELHKRVGDTVEASYGTITKRTVLRIVGTATMPAVGPGLGLHLSMGTGALVSDLLIPADVRNPTTGPPGPAAIFVRLRTGANPAASLASLRRIDTALDADSNAAPMSVLSVQRPADIVNYRSMGSTPVILGAGLAVGAVVALGLTLLASVRRQRRDLAMLKTLGFTQRQLAAVVAWQSSVAAVVGILFGVPLGIVVGRSLWDLFAHEISAVPAPSVPVLAIALIVVGALVLANLVAFVPGRIAARTSTALMLRTE